MKTWGFPMKKLELSNYWLKAYTYKVLNKDSMNGRERILLQRCHSLKQLGKISQGQQYMNMSKSLYLFQLFFSVTK